MPAQATALRGHRRAYRFFFFVLLAKLRQGALSTAGLRSAWFIFGWPVSGSSQWFRASLGQWPVASSVNGVWDDAWRTWALVAEFFLGEECEIVPAMEMVLKVVRKSPVSGHHQWLDQARCDYSGVAMWFFARDYRAYRERRLVETKPSLLAIFQSTDYLIYFKMHLEYAASPNVRPNKMPYSALVIGG